VLLPLLLLGPELVGGQYTQRDVAVRAAPDLE
jgi:hypothetical protein